MGSSRRDVEIEWAIFITEAKDGDLVTLAEPVVSYNFDPTADGPTGFYVDEGSQLLVLERRLAGGNIYVRVLTDRGPTWLHRTTCVRVR